MMLSTYDRVPATAHHKEVWLSMQQGSEAARAWTYPVHIDLNGQLDRAALESALRIIIQRHQAFRSTISDDGMYLHVYRSIDACLNVEDLSGLQDPDLALTEFANREAATPFDLSQPSLFRTHLLKVSDERHVLVLAFCHLVVDGGAIAIVLDELAALYSFLSDGRKAVLPPADQLTDYMAAVDEERQSDKFAKARDYWSSVFASAPPMMDVPGDELRPAMRTFASHEVATFLDADLPTDVKAFAKQTKVSLFFALLAAKIICLSRWSGQRDICVGVPAAGNHALGFGNVVGHCIDMVPLRVELNDSEALCDFLVRLRGLFYEAIGNQIFTFSDILREMSIPRSIDRPPLIPVVFNLNPSSDIDRFGTLDAGLLDMPRYAENFEIFFNLYDEGDTIKAVVTCNKALYSSALVDERFEDFKTGLHGFISGGH